MVNCEIFITCPTILTGILVTPKDFFSSKFDLRPRTPNHTLETDDRRARESLVYRVYNTAAVYDQSCFFKDDQSNGTAYTAHIEGFKIRVENQYGFHGKPSLIIARVKIMGLVLV